MKRVERGGGGSWKYHEWAQIKMRGGDCIGPGNENPKTNSLKGYRGPPGKRGLKAMEKRDVRGGKGGQVSERKTVRENQSREVISEQHGEWGREQFHDAEAIERDKKHSNLGCTKIKNPGDVQVRKRK